MAQPKQQATGWVGWIYFASMMLLILGGLQIISGLVALFNKSFYLIGDSGLVVWNYAAWGWIHLVMGIIIVLTGTAVVTGKTWARVIASLIVVIVAIDNITFFPAYPIWSTIALIICAFVLYAITVHGRELAEDY